MPEREELDERLAGDAAMAKVRDLLSRLTMKELYSMRLRTWFPGGLDDPHLTLVRFDAIDGEFWDTPGGMLQALSAFTKAVATGSPGPSGRAGVIDLTAASASDSRATDHESASPGASRLSTLSTCEAAAEP